MTNMKATKRALVSSVLALFLCFAMLLGTTYAWFTDEVSSANNIIQTGTLDIEMWYGDAADNLTEVDENTPAIFNYKHWEPGYTEVKYVQIKNVGSLAFKFKLDIVANIQPAAGQPNLAEVIDVYMFDPTATVGRAEIAAATPVGTLAELMADVDGAAHGVLLPAAGKGTDDYNQNENANTPAGEITYCIVLKMQEDAGNEYQNLSVGDGFSLQLMATQYTWENDSFNHEYDDGAEFDESTRANVTIYNPNALANINVIDMNKNEICTGLDTGYSFQPNESYEQSLVSEDCWSHADFFVYTDKNVPANSMVLAGYYKAFGDYLQIDQNTWIGLTANGDLPGGKENGIRLLGDAMGGVTVAYSEICNYANDGIGFLCGAKDLTGENAGTTLTVELRLYKTECDDSGCHHPSTSCETGEYIVVGTFTYTFGE